MCVCVCGGGGSTVLFVRGTVLCVEIGHIARAREMFSEEGKADQGEGRECECACVCVHEDAIKAIRGASTGGRGTNPQGCNIGYRRADIAPLFA